MTESSSDDKIYDAIHKVLDKLYPMQEEKTECMIYVLYIHNVTQEFETTDPREIENMLEGELKPTVEKAYSECTDSLAKSPIFMTALIVIFLVIIKIISSICC